VIRHQFTVACDSVIRNADDNTMSVISIHEDIEAVAYPLVMPRVYFLTLIERDPTVDPAEIQLDVSVSLDGEVFARGQVDLNFMDKRRTRYVSQFTPLIVARPGTLRYELSIDVEVRGFYELGFRLASTADDAVTQLALPAAQPTTN
jgi:hypothetical protein